jgi:hypothetical protein
LQPNINLETIMGLFDKLFGGKKISSNTQSLPATETIQLQKGDTFVSTGDNYGFKIIRPLTEEQRERIEKSTILLRTGQLYMHYWTDNLICTNPNDPFGKLKNHFRKNHYRLFLRRLRLNISCLQVTLQIFHYKLDKQCLGLGCQGLVINMYAK